MTPISLSCSFRMLSAQALTSGSLRSGRATRTISRAPSWWAIMPERKLLSGLVCGVGVPCWCWARPRAKAKRKAMLFFTLLLLS
jgi:hypothetical protein